VSARHFEISEQQTEQNREMRSVKLGSSFDRLRLRHLSVNTSFHLSDLAELEATRGGGALADGDSNVCGGRRLDWSRRRRFDREYPEEYSRSWSLNASMRKGPRGSRNLFFARLLLRRKGVTVVVIGLESGGLASTGSRKRSVAGIEEPRKMI